MKETLIKFLEWMNDVSRKDPMRFETDNDDIVMMFLAENKKVHTKDYKYQLTIETNEKGEVFTNRKAGKKTNLYLIISFVQIELQDLIQELRDKKHLDKTE